jgi:ammonium transporter, Amt family
MAAAAATTGINPGDTAWMFVATALVLMMTPALGLFYAGLVRAKNVLNTFMMSIGALGVVAITWAVVGYSIAFGGDNALVGNFKNAFMSGVGFEPRAGTAIPHLLFFAFEATFCIITAALISGAVVERMRYGTFLVFMILWSIVVYAVLAHWVWGGGWLAQHGTLDFAGGVPVEMASGFSALAAALAVGPRKDYGRQALLPHNAVYVLLGAGLLWFGWFGFNGGSGYTIGNPGVLAFTNTLLAPACTLVVWFLLDLRRDGHVTAVGAATAIVVGCVGITPACGYISPIWAMVLGALAALPSYAIVVWRTRTRVDETLDVLAAHGLAGLTGILFIGFAAQKSWNGLSDGFLYGNLHQLGWQAMAALVVPAYAFGATFGLLKLIGLVMPLRVSERAESLGLDTQQHGEEAYTSAEGAILVTTESLGPEETRLPVAVPVQP